MESVAQAQRKDPVPAEVHRCLLCRQDKVQGTCRIQLTPPSGRFELNSSPDRETSADDWTVWRMRTRAIDVADFSRYGEGSLRMVLSKTNPKAILMHWLRGQPSAGRGARQAHYRHTGDAVGRAQVKLQQGR